MHSWICNKNIIASDTCTDIEEELEMWEDSKGVLNEGTLGENVEAKHSPRLDLNLCRGEERIDIKGH